MSRVDDLEPAAIGVGIGAVVAAVWLVVIGGPPLLVLAKACCGCGGVGLVIGLMRTTFGSGRR